MTNTVIKQRVIDASVKNKQLTVHPLLNRIYLGRGITSTDELDYSTQNLLNFSSLYGVEDAVKVLYNVAQNQQTILVVGDFDTDGATSTALVITALKHFGIKNVSYIIPDRFEDGYGLSESVINKAIDLKTHLIITVDNGVSANEAVLYAKKNNIKVIITDHHLAPDNLPEADAIINPNLPNCKFPSKNLAGVGVAFYFMLAFRAFLRNQDWFTLNQIQDYNLANLLDLVALGTVADLVDLDYNNRILVKQGIARIRTGHCCAGIKKLLEISKKNIHNLTSTDLSFYIAPRINAAGRMDHMSLGVELLIADNESTASELADLLEDLNQSRKSVELNMQKQALNYINQLEAKTKNIPSNFVIYHPEFHQGVIGVLSSRIKERFYRPVISFADAENDFLKGSGRSILGVHLRNILEEINIKHPKLIICFGGHAMAAGLTIKKNDLSMFSNLFNQMLNEKLQNISLENLIETDGEVESGYLNYETAKLIKDHGLWGAKFPEPTFEGVFDIYQQKIVGSKHLKLVLSPKSGASLVNAIAFNVDLTQWPDFTAKEIKIVYSLEIDEFKGNQGVTLVIKHLDL